MDQRNIIIFHLKIKRQIDLLSRCLLSIWTMIEQTKASCILSKLSLQTCLNVRIILRCGCDGGSVNLTVEHSNCIKCKLIIIQPTKWIHVQSSCHNSELEWVREQRTPNIAHHAKSNNNNTHTHRKMTNTTIVMWSHHFAVVADAAVDSSSFFFFHFSRDCSVPQT